MPDIKIGDWVIIMDGCVVPLGEDASSYGGMIGVVEKIIGNNKVWLDCPMKLFYGKRPQNHVPIHQIVKIDKSEGERIFTILKLKYDTKRTK